MLVPSESGSCSTKTNHDLSSISSGPFPNARASPSMALDTGITQTSVKWEALLLALCRVFRGRTLPNPVSSSSRVPSRSVPLLSASLTQHSLEPHLSLPRSHKLTEFWQEWTLKTFDPETSLVVQQLRIYLPKQGTRVQSLLQEDSTWHRATKPMSQNYWACALQTASCNHRAHMPFLCNKRSHHSEKPTHHE